MRRRCVWRHRGIRQQVKTSPDRAAYACPLTPDAALIWPPPHTYFDPGSNTKIRFDTFGGMMTGNSINFAIRLQAGEYPMALATGSLLLAFVIGEPFASRSAWVAVQRAHPLRRARVKRRPECGPLTAHRWSAHALHDAQVRPSRRCHPPSPRSVRGARAVRRAAAPLPALRRLERALGERAHQLIRSLCNGWAEHDLVRQRHRSEHIVPDR